MSGTRPDVASAPLTALWEAERLPRPLPLPDALVRRYGGPLGLPAPVLVANFVSSLDGVVALEGVPHSNRLIAARNEADRFVMGLLRACADAVLVGAGTLRAAPRSRWTPASVAPDVADDLAELRRRSGRSAEPRLVVVSASGDIDPDHPGLSSGALVLTTRDGAARLDGRLPAGSTVTALGRGPTIDLAGAVAAVRSEGHAVVLSEGGPTVLGGLLDAGLVDELFLTLSPVLAGRSGGARPGLVEGVELLPTRSVTTELLSVRAAGSHLFLRFSVPR
jgi:riboflavin biosynthesis pyrimidine reductase